MNIAMNNQVTGYRELSQFLQVLGAKKQGSEPLLKRASRPDLLVQHLEKELPVTPAPVIFRRLGKHTQLCLHFS